MNELNVSAITGGLIVGLLFGVVMQRSRFCMVAAVSNIVLMRDYRHAQAFLAAWAIAIPGVMLVEHMGWVAIAEAGYRSARLNCTGAITGGMLFGFGAALAGGCAARTVVSAAEGHLGSLLTLLAMTLFAGITTFGILEPARMALTDATAITVTSGDSGLAALLHLPAWLAGIVFSVVLIGLIIRLGQIKENAGLILSGAAIGALVVFAWLVNGWWAVGEFGSTRPAAIAITGPLARFSYLLMTNTGSMLNFGGAFIVATFVSAMVSALLRRGFIATVGDVRRIPLNLLGGAFMGIGATFAGGCNIGQGLSGVSTLSITSILAIVAMIAGTVLGVKWWERRA
ncbi:MAG: YeeE/YedE family protein [Acidiferrobacterales bacterium]|jgi:uncharacterized membrane protein YedE/YeeE|nr:YeeE/YedE family protein [Acidiferrobacterales bacterium]